MKKVFKKIFELLAFALGCDCDTRRGAVDDGICNFGGQGKNKYGR